MLCHKISFPFHEYHLLHLSPFVQDTYLLLNPGTETLQNVCCFFMQDKHSHFLCQQVKLTTNNNRIKKNGGQLRISLEHILDHVEYHKRCFSISFEDNRGWERTWDQLILAVASVATSCPAADSVGHMEPQ